MYYVEKLSMIDDSPLGGSGIYVTVASYCRFLDCWLWFIIATTTHSDTHTQTHTPAHPHPHVHAHEHMCTHTRHVKLDINTIHIIQHLMMTSEMYVK